MCYNQFLTQAILFSTAARALVVAKLVMSGISPLKSFILALREALIAKWVILGISLLTPFTLALRVVLVGKLVISPNLFLMFVILALYTSFLTTPFSATSLSLHKSTGTETNLSLLIYFTFQIA